VIQETAAQNIKNELQSSIENKRIEELKSKPVPGQFYRTFTDHQLIEKNPWLGYVAQVYREKLRV